jgi:hypothetical protein
MILKTLKSEKDAETEKVRKLKATLRKMADME